MQAVSQKKTKFHLTIQNTYKKHITTVNCQIVPLMPCNGPSGTYFDKLLVIVVKQAKVDGCMPSHKARLSQMSCICPYYI
jgi:hypothetical protein